MKKAIGEMIVELGRALIIGTGIVYIASLIKGSLDRE